jgi:(E)-4-hydroxy-3-methylbut-2-enyl-diphosphate synthase
MDAAHRPYPLHLGVTEAGDGEDGRIKGAIGIGTLLLDGLGDTIRVSLTEDSVYEIPVARAIAEKAMSLWSKPEGGDRKPDGPTIAAIGFPVSTDSIDPFHFVRRETHVLSLSDRCSVGPEQPPRVIVRVPAPDHLAKTARELGGPSLKDTPVEGLMVPVADAETLAKLRQILNEVKLPVDFLVLDLAETLAPADLAGFVSASRGRLVLCRRFRASASRQLADMAELVRRHGHFLAIDMVVADFPAFADTFRSLGDNRLIFTLSSLGAPATRCFHALGAYRQLAEHLLRLGFRAPLWIRNTAATATRDDTSFLGRLLEASVLTGGLLCDGLGDLVSIETEADPIRAAKLTYNVLQGAGARISKTEFVACPSCGRTLFDLQTTTQRIREKTGHLKGVKIAIMGCIVNGPGEMADADFGYVGGAPGKINLYVGRNCVQYHLPQAEADDRLIALIKAHGKWLEPSLPTAP